MEHSWSEDRNCKDVDTNIFFGFTANEEARAKSICKDCPVSYECLSFAIDNHIDDGVWGGLTEKERRSIKYKQRYARRRRTA